MKNWKIAYESDCWTNYEWIEAETKAQANRLWKVNNPGIKALGIEEEVNILDLFFEAEEAINKAIRGTKHLEIDDCDGNDVSWFVVRVWYFIFLSERPLHKIVREFRFSRGNGTSESEAEMVDRFHRELNEFLTENNWKRIDKQW